MAQKEILSTLFQHVSNLQNWEVEALLEEPAESVQRRAVLQQVRFFETVPREGRLPA